MNTGKRASSNTPAWMFFVWASFCLSTLLMCTGIYYTPVDAWVKGYLVMGFFFTMGSVFTLSKTIRDNHEATRYEV